jgi:hypothetical protein
LFAVRKNSFTYTGFLSTGQEKANDICGEAADTG